MTIYGFLIVLCDVLLVFNFNLITVDGAFYPCIGVFVKYSHDKYIIAILYDCNFPGNI